MFEKLVARGHGLFAPLRHSAADLRSSDVSRVLPELRWRPDVLCGRYDRFFDAPAGVAVRVCAFRFSSQEQGSAVVWTWTQSVYLDGRVHVVVFFASAWWLVF